VNLVVSQALATGLPVITTRHSGLPEQVQDGVSGFVVEEGDFQALADRILFLADHSELLTTFGKEGRRHVAEHYNAATLVERQIAAYHEVVAAASRADVTR
jgi:colanic acid/amylovoran biosynthesis glycosyltransferase